MQRRQLLIGSGLVLATGLTGQSSAGSTQDGKNRNKKSTEKESATKETDSKQDRQKDEKEDDSIPGFDREAFELDSDVLQVKELAFEKGTLNLSVFVRTSDRDVLVEELQALAPAFDQAIRAAEADGFDTEYDAFFEAVEEFHFTLYAEQKRKVAAVFLNIRWLREFLDGDLTNTEFVDRLLNQMAEA